MLSEDARASHSDITLCLQLLRAAHLQSNSQPEIICVSDSINSDPNLGVPALATMTIASNGQSIPGCSSHIVFSMDFYSRHLYCRIKTFRFGHPEIFHIPP